MSYHHRVAPPGGSRVESGDAEDGNGVGDAARGADDLATDTEVKQDGSDNIRGKCESIGVFESVLSELLLVWPNSWTPAVAGLFVCVSESVSLCVHSHDPILLGA